MTAAQQPSPTPVSYVNAPEGARKPFRLFGITIFGPTVTYCSQCQHKRLSSEPTQKGEDVLFYWCEMPDMKHMTSRRLPLCCEMNDHGKCHGFMAHPSMAPAYISKSSQDFMEYLHTSCSDRSPHTEFMYVPTCIVG